MVELAAKPTVQPTEPTPYRFTVDEFIRLGEVGIFREHDRVELIDGRIIEMAAIGLPHATCVMKLNTRLGRLVGNVAFVSPQNPVQTDPRGLPQPDLAVCRLEVLEKTTHPQAEDVLLLIEVADSSLAFDRDTKVPLYGRTGFPETWLVALTEKAVYVYRDPSPDGYRTMLTFRKGDKLAPQAFPRATTAVAAILG